MRAIRSIVWQNCIDEKKAVIFGSVRKADAALAGVEMELARNPHIGDSSWIVYEASTGEQLRAFKTRAEAFTTVVVYFTVDDSSVTVYDIVEAFP